MTQIIQAVVFDMDDVLCEYRFDIRLAELSRLTGSPPDRIESAIWRSGFDEDGDRGRYTAQAYLAEFNRRLGSALSADEWLEARRLSIVPDEAVLELARAVSVRVEVALLTNNNPLFKRGMAQVFPQLTGIFGRHAHCAYEFGGAKPEPLVFENLARSLGVACHQVLFIDDTAEYLQGAGSVGVRGHHFNGAEALRGELDRLGLL